MAGIAGHGSRYFRCDQQFAELPAQTGTALRSTGKMGAPGALPAAHALAAGTADHDNGHRRRQRLVLRFGRRKESAGRTPGPADAGVRPKQVLGSP